MTNSEQSDYHLREPSSIERGDRSILLGFPELVEELGGDSTSLLRRVTIDPTMLRRGQSEVSYRQLMDLVTIAARELDCPDFGMRLAKHQAHAIRTPLLKIVQSSATLGDALDEVVRHSYAHSLAATVWLRKSPDEETVMLGHDILIAGAQDRRQAIEQILLVEYLTCLAATAGQARARRVEFRHQPISPPARYRAYFGCEARFDQPVDAIVYGEQALSVPISTPDPTSRRQTIAGIDAAFAQHKPPLPARTRGLIVHLLGSERCSVVEVASNLGLHERTLHRTLRREGTSFQEIKNQVRRDLLIDYLDRTDFPLAQISERLGFAEQSAMTRFCRRWLGTSPSKRRAGTVHHSR
jgi:AraC-like DNA-binding protein